MPKCKKCGNCCRVLWIVLYEFDLIREPKLRRYVTEFLKRPGEYMLDQPCPFLVNNRCKIYPTRPTVCLWFVPGSNKCCPQKGKK